MLALLFAAVPLFLPLMRHVRAEPATGQASTRGRSADEEAIRAGAVE